MPDDFNKKLGNVAAAVVATCVMLLVFGTTVAILIWMFRQL